MFLDFFTSFIVIQQRQMKYINIMGFGRCTGISIRLGGSEIRGSLTFISSVFQEMCWFLGPIYQLYLRRNWSKILCGLHTCSCQRGHCCKMLWDLSLWTFIWTWRISVRVLEIRGRALLCPLSTAILCLQFLVDQKSRRGSNRQEYY